jgi:cation-dependent mannose-6-phosphate receptor
MTFLTSFRSLLFAVAFSYPALAADSKPTNQPCTIHSPSTGSFYDLRPLQAFGPDQTTKASLARNESWHARGYDYHANFTLNFCGPVVENLTDVDGVSKTRAANISAFYIDPLTDSPISIGEQNSALVFRGKKLLLNYTNGSPCPDLDEEGQPILSLSRRAILDDDDDDDDDDDEDEKPKKPSKKPSPRPSMRHKSTLLSFLCDTAPSSLNHPAVSFLGSPDHCTYIFEVKSRWACAGATPSTDPGSLGPGGVFGVILAIALLVYLIGGCVYNRTVMHQRGWRQLPNYAVWSGIGGFIGVSRIFSCCGRNRRWMVMNGDGTMDGRRGSWDANMGIRRRGSEDEAWKLP